MPTDPNHGYNVPSQGATDWHTPLNQNFNDLAVDVELRGNGAPSTVLGNSGVNGQKYIDTSTGEVYFSDGSSWTQEFDMMNKTGGGSVYLSSNQTISAGAQNTITFDSATADARSEFDLATGVFECEYAGNYHVEAAVSNLSGSLTDGENYTLYIMVDGVTKARNICVAHTAASNTFPTYTISKTLYGLTDTSKIEIEYYNSSTNDVTVFGSSDDSWTYFSVSQVG